MDRDPSKRSAEEVLFKWDDDLVAKRRPNVDAAGPAPSAAGHEGDPFNPREANVFHNVNTSRVVPMEDSSSSNVRLQAKQLRETIAKIHLTHNRDWLAANSRVTALAKLDVLDKISCLFLNREGAMKYESLRYLQRECSSEFEFNRMIYEHRLQRLNSGLMPELCVQPIYIRNSTLISKMKNKCSCPLHVYIEWDIQQPLPTGAGRSTRAVIGEGNSKMMTAARPSLNAGGSDGFYTARDSGGNAYGIPFPSLGPVTFGFSTSQDTSSTNVEEPNKASFENSGAIVREGLVDLSHKHGLSASEMGNWSLTAQDCKPSSQISTQVSNQSMVNSSPKKSKNAFEHLEAICPMHIATALPELFSSQANRVGALPDLELLYKYETSSINGESVHMLSFHKLSGDAKVYNYRLPSVFQAMNVIYLRDFEFERYNSALNYDDPANGNADHVRKTFLSSIYSGPALMIATASEFIIAIVHKAPSNLTIGVISREKNHGHPIQEVVCHRQSGRVFLLAANSLLYEYQYQLGSVDVKDYSILNLVMGTIAKGCRFVAKALTNDRVFRLHGTVSSGYSMEVDGGKDVHGRKECVPWWGGSGNCMDDFTVDCPLYGTLYWPPLQWRQLHLSLQESSFSEHRTKDTCDCSIQRSCVKRELCTCLKLLNPWCKSYFNLFSSGNSTISMDQDRWLLSLLSKDTGDLSVFKIPDESSFDSFVKGAMDFERIFPYTLTFFSLRNSDIVQQLTLAGYFRQVPNMTNFRCCSVLAAPLHMNNGVQVILVDNLGARIYVGFVVDKNMKVNLAVKGFKIPYTLLESRLPEPQVHPGRPVNLMRGPTRGMDCVPVPIKRTHFQPNDMFVTCELYAKTSNVTLCKVVVSTTETASVCQNSSITPRSVSEELWSHNQRIPSARGATDLSSQQPRSKPIEWFDEFCILLSPGEDVVHVYVDDGRHSTAGATWESSDSKLVIITSTKVYTLHRGSPLKLLKALLNNPVSTLKYLDPPLIAHNHRAALFALKNSRSESKEAVQFVDIFQDDTMGDICGEGEKREAIANGLYYLCWLYTPEEVFKACWRFLLDGSDPILEGMLLNGCDEQCLMLTSLGISSRLFGWTAPGAYALDDEGKPTTPIISPWCKFVIFRDHMMYRINRISTNLTSPALDGMLSLLSSIVESVWFDRTFVCVPLFTSVACSPIQNAAVPFSPQNQINRRNEFVIGPKFETDLILSLARPVDEVKATLMQLRKLYLLLLRVAQNYETLSPKSVELMAESISRLALNLQRDIFVEESHPENLICSSSNAFDAKVVLQRLSQRREQDYRMIKEMATVLEITQEYLACCLLLHLNCILGDVKHDFAKMITDVELLPSKSPGRFTCGDLCYNRLMQLHEPLVMPFSMQNNQLTEKPKYAFTMSRQFFYLISKSNMLNLCSNQEFFRAFRVAVWLAGGEVSNLQDHFYGHLFKPDELRIKHWSSMVKSLEKQLELADSDASISHYARLLMKFIGNNHNLNCGTNGVHQ